MKKSIAVDGKFVLTTRQNKGLNQSEFWAPIGVTQSGGSRYENGRRIPASVRKLIWLIHVVGIEANLIQRLAKA